MKTKIKIGNIAPNFLGKTDSGEEIQLLDYRGRTVVLFFYPAANSPGCTTQACGFRDIYDELLELGTEVIGISLDSKDKQKDFRIRRRLQFPLIVDGKEIAQLYGGVGQLGKANRYTLLIDPQGRIRKIWKLTGIFAQMKLGSHAEEVKKAILTFNGQKFG
ncbi:MAG: peroxiredoxin [Promethearchaeota archaeon]